MSCSSIDWKAYALNELGASERRDAESHASTCSQCRDELSTLRLTLDGLSSLRDEELPRRIAFVSDKVFEPRWWQMFLRPSFAAALVIALAIIVHGFVVRHDVQASVDQAVAKAVAQIEEQNQRQMAGMQDDYKLLSKQFTQIYAMNTGLVRQ